MMHVLERELEERIHHDLPHLALNEVYDLACVVGRLVERFQPERVYVFGSQARGEPTPDSEAGLRDLRSQILSILWLVERDPGIEAAADDLFNRISATCSSCHAQFRAGRN